MTVTLQLIPILQNEFAIVLSAQKSRGLKGTGFSALLPSMVPVFVGAIERVSSFPFRSNRVRSDLRESRPVYRNIHNTIWDFMILG